jgi:hypothetical protein
MQMIEQNAQQQQMQQQQAVQQAMTPIPGPTGDEDFTGGNLDMAPLQAQATGDEDFAGQPAPMM